jgi:hypothetical protein
LDFNPETGKRGGQGISSQDLMIRYIPLRAAENGLDQPATAGFDA